MFSSLSQDLVFAFRTFRARPAVTVIALVTLALGIGANTAIFSVVHAVLLRPLPFPDAERIVSIYATNRKYQFTRGVMSPFDYDYLEQRAQSFEALALTTVISSTLTTGGEPTRLRGARVSPSYFRVFGLRPVAGRILADDDVALKDGVAMISSRLWRERFNNRPDVINSVVVLDARPWTIVGVMAPDASPDDTDLWIPFGLKPEDRQAKGSWFLGVAAKLKPGVSPATAQAELSALYSVLEQTYPKERKDRGLNVVELRADRAYRSADGLRLLQGVVVFVLLIACANVANLLLAQAAWRQREFGVRAAVGASRWRLIRQSLTESVALSLAGALLGAGLAYWGVRGLIALAPPFLLPAPETIGVSWQALLFTASIAAITGVVFGVLPALVSSLVDFGRALNTGARAIAGGLTFSRRQWMRAGLVAGEIALALILLTGAGLLVRSFSMLLAQPLGFRSEGLLTAQFSLPIARYGSLDAQLPFWLTLRERAKSIPGVRDVALSNALPFSNWEWQSDFRVAGRENVANDGAGVRTVSAGFFETLGIPIRRGRDISDSDTTTSARVAVVSDEFVRLHMDGLEPIGHGLTFVRDGKPMTIVGVVGSTRQLGLDEKMRADIYVPVTQRAGTTAMQIALRTDGDPLAAAPALRAIVNRLDPLLPLQEVRTMDDLIGRNLAQRRFYLVLLGAFAALAGALAAIGVYGVMSYVVMQGRRDIGIRLALGARASQVQAGVVAQGIRVVAAGLGAGLIGAYWLSGLLEKEVFAIQTTDPATFAGVAAGLMIAAIVACWIPARRTSRVDPVSVLRTE